MKKSLEPVILIHGMALIMALLTGLYVAEKIAGRLAADTHVIATRDERAALVPHSLIREERLPNGMRIVVYENHSLPKVIVQIGYNVGSAHEKPGEKGLAHLLEHMIFKGTDKLSEGDIDAIARKYGASYNAFTAHDMTAYYMESDSANWRTFVDLLRMFTSPRFDEQHLASEMKAVVNELRMGEDDTWRYMVGRAISLAFPEKHPYHDPIIGYKQDLVSIHTDALKAFYDTHYVPSRATLMIIGDVNADEALAYARAQFSNVPAVPAVAMLGEHIPQMLDLETQKTTVYRDIVGTQLCAYWVIPGLQDAGWCAAEAVADVLGASRVGRLYRALIDEEKCASSVMVQALHLQQAGVFLILVEPHEGALEKVRRVIDRELTRVCTEGVCEEELARVYYKKRKSFWEAQEKFSRLAHTWMSSYFASGDAYAYFEIPEKFRTLAASDVQSWAQRYLAVGHGSEIVVLPATPEQKTYLHERRVSEEALEQAILASHERIAPLESPSFALSMPDPQPLHLTSREPDAYYTLPNGLGVVLARYPDRATFIARLYARDAYLLSHSLDGVKMDVLLSLLAEGTKQFSAEELTDQIAVRGGSISIDETGIVLAGLYEDAPRLIKLLGTMIRQPRLDTAALNKLLTMYDDQYARVEESPRDLAMRALYSQVYNGHPYQWTFEDARGCLRALRTMNIKNLYQQMLVPSRFVLSIAGGIGLDEVQKAIQEAFGSWQGDQFVMPTPRTTPIECPSMQQDIPLVRSQLLLMLGKGTPITVHSPELAALQVLNSACLQGLGSRLYQLRERSGLFYAASAAWGAGATLGHGFDVLYTSVAPAHAAIALDGMRELIDAVAREGITSKELESARTTVQRELLIDTASLSSTVSRFCRCAAYGLAFDFYDQMARKIQQLSLDEVNEVARRFFTTTGLHVIRVGSCLSKNPQADQTNIEVPAGT